MCDDKIEDGVGTAWQVREGSRICVRKDLVRVLFVCIALHVGHSVVGHSIPLYVEALRIKQGGSAGSGAKQVLPSKCVPGPVEAVEGHIEVCARVNVQCHAHFVVLCTILQ